MKKQDLAKIDLPDHPGVYFFRDADSTILYIGKATSLKDRVRSYFNPDLIDPVFVAVQREHSSIGLESGGIDRIQYHVGGQSGVRLCRIAHAATIRELR